ncbi:hypothetical protein V7182_13400 [Neobacillus drentensis]|uniref:hypothetical protein n=1 Tax=Neobacillus drentensis TaxID=220684 RepID=UPI002FFE419C
MRKIKGMNLPFLLLCVIHSCLLGITFYKNKNRKNIFILLVSNIGLAYLFEYFVFNLFKLYKYKPNIIRNNFFDNVFGAVLSQAVFVPFTSVFLTVSNSGWLKKISASMYFYFIEKLFLRLGVYKHTGWKTVYTFALIPFYFKWSDIWYHLLEKKNDIVRFISFFLMIMVTETNLFLILALFRKIRFGVGRHHSWKEHFIISPLYSISVSLFTAFSLKNHNTLDAKLRVVIFCTLLKQFFIKIKLLKNNIKFYPYVLKRVIIVALYGKYRKWVYGEGEIEKES